MDKPVKLYCTQDEDTNEWLVWFPHPLGGMYPLGTFGTEAEARQYLKEQIDLADYKE